MGRRDSRYWDSEKEKVQPFTWIDRQTTTTEAL